MIKNNMKGREAQSTYNIAPCNQPYGELSETKSQERLNEYFVVDDTVYFELKGRGKNSYAIISLNKWPAVSKYEWYLGKSGYPICYDLSKMKLHRFIFIVLLGERPPADIYIDHIDRNKLNNTDGNLRMVTPQENSFNKSTQSNKKGVKKISDGNYTATVVKNGIRHEIKNIPTGEQAAEIYNCMAEELFGEYAAYNNTDVR